MADLYFAKISAVNEKEGTADIIISEKENQVINDVPYLAYAYEMPRPGDTVAALLEFNRGDFDKGILMGPVFTPKNKPEESGKDIFYKRFKDGAKIRYDSRMKTMTVSAEKVEIKDGKMKNITVDSIKTKTLDADSITYETIGQR